MGSAYKGYVVWKSGEATKYYAFDLDTTDRAVMRASDQPKLPSFRNIPQYIEVPPNIEANRIISYFSAVSFLI
jgi:hypothetical protein